MVRFAEKDELMPLNPRSSSLSNKTGLDDSSDSDEDETSKRASQADQFLTPGLGVTTRAQGYTKQESMQYHMAAIRRDIMESFRGLQAWRNHEPSVRSKQRARLNIVFGGLLALTLTLLLTGAGWMAYTRIYAPIHNHHLLEQEIKKHAEAARERAARCQGFDWKRACDALGPAGARRRRTSEIARNLYTGQGDRSGELEDQLMLSDDPTVTYDEHCLRVYRLQLQGNITFPYHSSQLLHLGGVRSLLLCL